MNKQENRILKTELLPKIAVIVRDIQYLRERHDENRQDIKDIKDKLFSGEGKISKLKESLKKLWWVVGIIVSAVGGLAYVLLIR